MEEVGKNDAAIAWVVIGGIGGGILGYWKGHDDGYEKAKSEDVPYMRSLENQNAWLQNEKDQLVTELWQERSAKADIQKELERLQKEMVQLGIQKKKLTPAQAV